MPAPLFFHDPVGSINRHNVNGALHDIQGSIMTFSSEALLVWGNASMDGTFCICPRRSPIPPTDPARMTPLIGHPGCSAYCTASRVPYF